VILEVWFFRPFSEQTEWRKFRYLRWEPRNLSLVETKNVKAPVSSPPEVSPNSLEGAGLGWGKPGAWAGGNFTKHLHNAYPWV
jgi:hypothetical protein